LPCAKTSFGNALSEPRRRQMRRRDFITLIGSAAHSFFAGLAIAFPNSFWDWRE
jgi:zinc transporter ZupT